jgi:hypothetical protein
LSTARPSKALQKAVRQYADDLTASVRAIASAHLQHDLEQHYRPDSGVVFQYSIPDARFESRSGGLTVTAYQSIVPRAESDHAGLFSVARYGYHLRSVEGDKLLRWDFDPGLPPAWPHVHLDTATANVAGQAMSAHHLPTGRVLLEDVLRYLVHDCGVMPVRDYEATLAVSEQWFDEARWGTARGRRATES